MIREPILSINTPGYYYAIAYIAAVFIMILCLPKRENKLWRSIAAGGIGILTLIISVITDGILDIFFPVMLFYVLAIIGTIILVCDVHVMMAVYTGVRAFIMAEFVAAVEWGLYYFFRQPFHLPANPLTQSVFLLVVDGLLFGLFYYLEREESEDTVHLAIHFRELFPVVLMGMITFASSNSMVLIGRGLFGEQVLTGFFIIRALVDLVGVTLIFSYHRQLLDMMAQNEREKLQNMLEMQYQNYEVLQKSMEIVNIKYHDLKHQIALLKEDASRADALESLEKMEREISIYEAQNKTGNPVLDTILTAKSLYCQGHWIELTVVAEGEALSFMDPMDLTSLFGNMLDNAIESVEKIEEKERRLIHLAVTTQRGFVRIRLENRYQQKPIILNGRIETTKSNRSYHGYGLKSIEATVQKYGGSLTIDAHDGWFEERILLPIHDN
ncbi:MAG: ATP-binding protein [Lachnospiraceae bacterium]|nr:ATP-binding protein [Lachnospiraceae bacterium]